MNKYLVAGFVLLSLSQIVKAGDLLLRPNEKAKIQRVVNSLAESVNAIGPFNVLSKLDSGPGIVLLAIPLIALVAMNTANISYEFFGSRISTWQWTSSYIGDFLISAFSILLGLVLAGSKLYTGWRTSIKKLLGDHTTRSFVANLGKLAAQLILSSLPLAAGIALMIQRYPAEPGTVLMGLVLVFVLVFVLFGYPLLAPVVSGVIALVIWAFAQGAYIVLLTVRRLVNNVAEYQKGAWEGILLLLTVTLGILIAYLQLLEG